MEKINIREAIKTIRKIYIDISAQEAEIIVNHYFELCTDIEEMKKIDVCDVEAMDYPVNVSLHSLRDDSIADEQKTSEVFKNAKTFNGKYVVIK